MKKEILEFSEINPIVGNVWIKNKWVKRSVTPIMKFDMGSPGEFDIFIHYNPYIYSQELRKEILWWILEFERKVTSRFTLMLRPNGFQLTSIIRYEHFDSNGVSLGFLNEKESLKLVKRLFKTNWNGSYLKDSGYFLKFKGYKIELASNDTCENNQYYVPFNPYTV